ncbi:MAG TPA: sensor histidine kinase [Myxococcota bacterium]|nr:sensor histidine kinase [Myxococcota bacterium]HRY94876.1 sensor histidine kinase [Myxococcota bacterium]HSA20925.1 sensor histidine kinase [Myxococcota bacterium]
MDLTRWFRADLSASPEGGWRRQRFVTRARTLFYARLAFLFIGLGILAIPRWAASFGAQSPVAFGVYFAMIAYSVACYLVVERGPLGKALTFFTLCLDLLVLVYMISFSGGLKSPVLPTQVVYTIFFALLFPNPLSILPPLLTLPIVAKIDTEIPGRVLELEDVFLLIWYSAVNFIVVYVIVYLNEREESQHNQIVSLEKELGHLAVMEERARLSREIHDGLGASLSSLIIQSEYLHTLAKEPELKNEIRELKEVAEESIDELRRSISMMRDDFELVPALEDYCANFGQRTGIQVEFRMTGRLPRLDGELLLAAFRVLQESLTNVRKHAQAKRVEVALSHLEGRLRLSVQDDGRGFDFQGTLKGHYGLTNMRERARHYGGEVTIQSAQGQGCQVVFEIPTHKSPTDTSPPAPRAAEGRDAEPT